MPSLEELIRKKTGNKADELDSTASVDDWKTTVPEGYDFDAVVDAPKEECPRCKKMIIVDQLASHKDSHSSEIIDGVLFLGGERNAKNEKELKERTFIKEILCVSIESTNQFPDDFMYHNYAFKDNADQDISEQLEEIISIIENAEKAGNPMLVHCVQGISRSATVVIAYCMKTRKWSLKESYDYVRSRRRIISPNEGFITQLGEYEKKLYSIDTPTLSVSDVFPEGLTRIQTNS